MQQALEVHGLEIHRCQKVNVSTSISFLLVLVYILIGIIHPVIEIANDFGMVTYIGEAISSTRFNLPYGRLFRKFGVRISSVEPTTM